VVWIAFALCVAVILVAGSRLTKYGDMIAEKTGLGRAWVGVVLLASVTSLPELVTGISSVAIFDVPNIALGDIFGSCMFNLLIVSLLDALERQQPLSARVQEGQALSASLGIFMLSTAAIGLLGRSALPAIGWVGSYSLVLIGLYVASMRAVFRYEKNRISKFVKEVADEAKPSEMPLRTVILRYAVHAAIVVVAATFLPRIGEEIAVQTGLTRTFVGTLFIAISTSLPELVVAITALRMDAADMAVGNIFGSNMFNMAILAIDDIAYVKEPLLLNASPDHIVSIVAAIAMTAIATAGITYRIRAKRIMLSWDSLAILITYGITLYVLYSLPAVP
jgi:cation:H+ antiporter